MRGHSLMPCRQSGDGYFCQAPQTPTYNFSTSGASGPGVPSGQASGAAPEQAPAGRRLSQAAAPAPAGAAGSCTQIGYYGTCGKQLPTQCPEPPSEFPPLPLEYP